MLELAAYAIGLLPLQEGEVLDYLPDDGLIFCRHGSFGCWNPCDDDGDAFRLGVDLKIVAQSHCSDEYDRKYAAAYIYDNDGCEVCFVREIWRDNPHAALRLAITRAAAEIGKLVLKNNNAIQNI